MQRLHFNFGKPYRVVCFKTALYGSPMADLKLHTENAAKPRLGRADWLSAALQSLIEDGIDAVQITRLATTLGASRGSFYWHFKSRKELLDGLLDEWIAANGPRIKQVLDRVDSLHAGILSFFAIWANPVKFNAPLEQAVRDWARLDAQVLAAVRLEDTRRIEAISAFFQRFHYAPKEAHVRARVLYFAQVGYVAMNTAEALDERNSMLEDYVFAFTGFPLDADLAARFRRDWLEFS